MVDKVRPCGITKAQVPPRWRHRVGWRIVSSLQFWSWICFVFVFFSNRQGSARYGFVAELVRLDLLGSV